MKTLINYIIIIILLGLTACTHHEEDTDKLSVQYRVSVDQPIIKNIIYKSADKQMVTQTESLQDVTLWHKTVFINDSFGAYKNVMFYNNYEDPISYKLSIFVEGILVKTNEGIIHPDQETTASLEYSILD